MMLLSRFYCALIVCTILTVLYIIFAPSPTFYHKAVGADDEHVRKLSRFSDDLSVFTEALDEIAIPRVVGTPGHEKVRQYIGKAMHGLGWQVEEDSFVGETPMGLLQFTNIIATHNPAARRFLDFACHYDSKYFKHMVFIGAMDSAAPCAMMIHLGAKLNELLTRHKQPEVGLRFIFFDGEEAFVDWTAQDSLYGSRHLAEKWQRTPYPEGGGDSNQLDRIDLLVLLDLLGPSQAEFYNFFSVTQNWYKVLVSAEDKLSRNNLLKAVRKPRYFHRMSTSSTIDDDHKPFLERDVPIVHIIPLPFPKEWHTAADTKDIISLPVVADLSRVFTIFISEYLHLNK